MFKKLKDTVIRSDRGNATISRSVGDRGSSGQISCFRWRRRRGVTTNNNNRGRARTLSNTSKGSETSVRSTVAKIGDSEFPLDPPSSLIDQDSDTASVTSSVFQSGTDVAELQSRFQRVHRLARGYKARYQEDSRDHKLSNFYKVLQRERDNLRELLNTSQAKAFKRIDELKEEVELDKKAKQDVDTNFRLMLSEKDEIINVLRLQVSLLREGKNLPEELEAKITAGHELEAKHQRAIEQENKELRTKLDEVISQLQLSTMQLQKQLMEQSSLQQTIVKYDAELKQMSIKVKESAQLRRELADSRLAQSALDEQVQALKSQLSSLSAERSTKDADGDKEAQLDEKLLLLTEQLRTKDERIIALENEQSQLKLIIDGVNQKASSADMEFKEREADLVQAETKDQIQLDTPDLVVVPLDSTSFDVKEPQDIRKNEFTIPGDFLNQLHLQINNRREQVTNQLGEEIPVGKLPILQSNLKSDETVQLQDDVNAMLSSIDALITRTRDIQQARIADQKRITELEAASSQDVDQVKLRESELKAQIIVLKQNRDSQLYELTEKHKQELSSVQSQLAVQTESNAQLEKRLTSAMNALEEVKKQTDEVRTELDSTKAEIVAKDNEFAALSSKYTELAQQRDAMLHQTYSPILVVDTLCGAKSTPQPTQGDDMPPATLSKVGDLRGKLVQIKEALDDLRVGYTNSSSVVGKDVEEVNGALNQLTMAWEEKVGSVNKLNAELQNQLQTMHRTVALTKDELAATRTLCDSLEATANTRGKQIKELESNVTTLNEQLSSLTAEHTKLLHDLEVATNDFDELVQLRVERDEIMAERIMEQQKQMIYEEERSEMNLFLEEFTGLAQRLDEQAEQIAKREEQVNRLTDVVYSSAERLAQSEAQLAQFESQVSKLLAETRQPLGSELDVPTAQSQLVLEKNEELKPVEEIDLEENKMADIRRRIEELKQEYSNFCDTNNRSLIDLIQRKILSAKSRLKLIQDEILIKTVNQTQGPVESEALPKIHAFANILPQLESRMLAASDLGLVERAGILWNDLNDLENLNHNLAELEKSAVCPGMYETVPLQKYDTAVPGVSGSVMEEERDRLLALRDQLEIELECVREELANEHKLLGEKSEQVKRLESILTTTQSHLADSDAQLMELRNLTNASAAKLEEKDRLAASLEEELLKLRSTQTDSSNELSGQTEKIHLLEENVTSLNEKMADLYNSEKEYLIGLISSQRSLLQSRIEHLRTMLTQLGRAESSDLIEELQSAEGCLGSIDQGLGSMECPALWETVNRLNDIGSKIFDFEKSSDQFAVVSGLQDQLKTSVEEKSEAESLLMHVQEEYDALRADRDRLENELNTAKIDLETLNKSHMEGGERVNNLESTLKYYETNLNEMGTKLKEAETSVRSNEELVKEKLVIIASLEDQLSEAKLKEDERAACITSKDREIHLLEENVTSLNEKMADLYNSEKEYLIGLISSQRSLLQSRIEHLRTMLTQLGRAESSDLIEELQSAEGCLGSIDQGLGSMECPALWETVNRLNDIGSKIFDFEKSSDQFAVVSGLQDQLKTSVEEKSEAESLLMHVQEEYDALRADRDRLENELNTAKIDLETLNKSHMEGGERVNNLESTLKYYETNLNEMGTKLKEAETSVRSNEELVKEKLVIIASLEDQLSEAKLKEDERAACITSKDRELTELREQLARGIAEWQSKYESLSKQLEQMNLEKDEALSEARSNFEEQLVNAAKAADQEKATLVEQQKVQLTRVESAAANKEKQWKRQLKDAKVHIKKLMIESEELRKANALAATREEELTSLLNEARSDLTAQLTEVDHLHSVVEQLKADRQFVSGGLETASSQKATISPSTTPDHPETASIDEMRESYQNDTEALKAEHAMHIKEMQQQFNDRLLDKEIELRNKYEKDLNHVRLQEERLQRIHEEELRNLNQLVDETKRKLGQAEARIEQLEVELQSLRRVNDVKLKSSTEHENESNVMKEMMRLREQLAQLKSEKSTTEDGELQTHQHITDGSKRNSILVSAHESEYPVVCDKVSAGSLQLARPPDESYLCEAKTPTWIEQLRNEIMQVDSIESLHPAIRSSNYVPSVTAHDYEVLQLHNLDLQNQLQQLSAEFETLRQHCAAQCAKQHNQAESTTPRLSVCTSLPLYSPTNDSPKSGSLYELVEFEYLRNVLFQYMMGRETATLAKVLCSLMRFNVDQTKKILQYEDSRNKQTWILRTTNQ
ncbi:unnamed protein product [Calicophoron daubneyi]|uniref:GRIP domain-containing protein n=1 Tax=Calicophoron daubneyi TaxID=300641 RepID=A0AAV2TZ42_CALDB